MSASGNRSSGRICWDLLITLLLWCYFTVGYVVFFAPIFIAALVVAGDREAAFQKLLHLFCRSFFGVMRMLIPNSRITVDESVRAIRSAVVIGNHLSYLDPVLMVAVFGRQKTIVKSSIFKLPIFGWILKAAGYLPASFDGTFTEYLIRQTDRLNAFLAAGGNIFVFPEGMRSRSGRLGDFKKGAFKIANRCNVPIQVLKIQNTQHLFRPGTFLFNTANHRRIEISRCGEVQPVETSRPSDIARQMGQARWLINQS